MVTRVMYRAGDPWVNLQPQIVAETDQERAVLWISWSGAVQVFARVDGELARLRQGSDQAAHSRDGLPLLVGHPFFATACGCGDAAGYRSTPPQLVAAAELETDVASLVADAMGQTRPLAADGFNVDQVSEHHPPAPCGAMYCPRIVPEAIIAGR